MLRQAWPALLKDCNLGNVVLATYDCLIDLKSVQGLAKTHQTGLGFVHAHHSDPSKEIGQPVALWLVETG